MAKQKRIEGMDEPRIAELDEAIDKYRSAVKQATKWREKKGVAQDELIALLHQHELSEYANDDYRVVLRDKGESLKVDVVDPDEEAQDLPDENE